MTKTTTTVCFIFQCVKLILITLKMQEPVCVEVLFITVFLWAAIWGVLELIADRLGNDTRRAAFYVILFMIGCLLLYLTPGLTTCRVL